LKLPRTSRSVRDCFGKWRVAVDEGVQKFFEGYGLSGELEEWRRHLEEELNIDPNAIFKLLKEPIIIEIGKVKWRRYRLYLKGNPFRLLFAISMQRCLVLFKFVEKRDEETYKRFKRKL